MNYIKKEFGEVAINSLDRAMKRFGDARSTDRPRPYAKNLPDGSTKYWVGECPKCGGRMHAAYFTQVGIRYMCSGCGFKEGAY